MMTAADLCTATGAVLVLAQNGNKIEAVHEK